MSKKLLKSFRKVFSELLPADTSGSFKCNAFLIIESDNAKSAICNLIFYNSRTAPHRKIDPLLFGEEMSDFFEYSRTSTGSSLVIEDLMYNNIPEGSVSPA